MSLFKLIFVSCIITVFSNPLDVGLLNNPPLNVDNTIQPLPSLNLNVEKHLEKLSSLNELESLKLLKSLESLDSLKLLKSLESLDSLKLLKSLESLDSLKSISANAQLPKLPNQLTQ